MKRQSGFSLLEIVIASLLLGMMLYSVAALSLSGSQASDMTRRLTRATEVTQMLVDEMKLDLVSSSRLFGNDTEGLANLAIFDLDGAPTVLSGTRLPTINASGTIRADTSGNEVTGNSLFFTKLSWKYRFVCPSSNEYVIDVYRWCYVYMTEENGGPDPANAVGLNLVTVTSEPLVDGDAIDRITDPDDKVAVLLHFVNGTPDATGKSRTPCEIVWKVGASPAVSGTIRQISSLTGLLSSTPIVGSGRASPFEIERSEATVQGRLYYRHHSVATNYAPASYGVGTFAIQSNNGSGFPHGFEVQIAGPSAARQVLLHLVVASTNLSGHTAWSNVQVVVDARDM